VGGIGCLLHESLLRSLLLCGNEFLLDAHWDWVVYVKSESWEGTIKEIRNIDVKPSLGIFVRQDLDILQSTEQLGIPEDYIQICR
jgi:hypothetical protein